MEETKLFLITYFAALLGVIPPGLVNMTVAKTCVKHGKRNGLYVAIGAATIVLIQALIAVLLAKYIFNHPFIQSILLRSGLVVFSLLAVYFFIMAKRKGEIKPHAKRANTKSIFLGMLVAVLNIFPIPFFVAIAGAMNVGVGVTYNWIRIITFALAASLGTFTTLYLYVLSFIKIESKTEKFSKYSNYFMVILMIILIIVTLFRIYNL